MTGEKLRAAVIGCGKIGSTFADDPNRDKLGVYSHAEAYSVCNEVELVAICDIDQRLAQSCAQRWGVGKIYTDAKELFESEKLDIVSICTPDSTHESVAMLALAANGLKGILMEKPLATDLSAAEKLVKLSQAEGVTLAVNYSRRYSPVFQKLKDRIAVGEIGALQAVHGYYTKGIIHNGTHWIDLLRFLVGDIVSGKSIGQISKGDIDPDLDAVFELECNALALLQVIDERAYSVFEMDLLGEDGRIRISDAGCTIEQYSVGPSPYAEGYQILIPDSQPAEKSMQDLTLYAVMDLVESINSASEPRCTGSDAMAALKLALDVCGRL